VREMFSSLRPGVVGFADRSLSWVRIADSRDSLEASSGLRQLPMLWETRRQGAINSPQQRKGRHPSPKGGARRVLDESRKWYTRLWTLPQRGDLVFPEARGGRLIYMVPPGNTPGSVSLLVSWDDFTLLVAGDTVWGGS